jgi:hypothetical protein
VISDLQVEVMPREITVTLPGTRNTVTYHRPASFRILIAKCQSINEDQRTSVTVSEFLGSA